MSCNAPAVLRKIPKDGPGPRGVPDCYYTSRVLDSTGRYAKFLRKLRTTEEDDRVGAESKLKQLKDTQTSDFFVSCDRRSLINNVARRVDLCMESYQEDLKKKRSRLMALYSLEEEENIRALVAQAQAGAEQAERDRLERLRHLLGKRHKEHLEKYQQPPLSGDIKVLGTIDKLRAKETQEVFLYQMREERARRQAQRELDYMWNDAAMKESDALAARMEYDAIELARKAREGKVFTDHQIKQRGLQREKEKELLREEARRFKAMWDADLKKEEDEQRRTADARIATAEERKKMIAEKQNRRAKSKEEERRINDTWDSLTDQGLADDRAKVELRKRRERELDECNKKLIEMRKQFEDIDKCIDVSVQEEALLLQNQRERKRCEFIAQTRIRTHNTKEEAREALLQQIRDREEARDLLRNKLADEDEFKRQQSREADKQAMLKEIGDQHFRQEHQKDLLEQIEIEKLLKEQAKQDEVKMLKQCDVSQEEQEAKRMMSRLFPTNNIKHPFKKVMDGGITMRDKCPCSKTNYCNSPAAQGVSAEDVSGGSTSSGAPSQAGYTASASS